MYRMYGGLQSRERIYLRYILYIACMEGLQSRERIFAIYFIYRIYTIVRNEITFCVCLPYIHGIWSLKKRVVRLHERAESNVGGREMLRKTSMKTKLSMSKSQFTINIKQSSWKRELARHIGNIKLSTFSQRHKKHESWNGVESHRGNWKFQNSLENVIKRVGSLEMDSEKS